MQSSLLITHDECTYSWVALLERALPHSPALWGRRASGRRMVLLIGRSFYQSHASYETTVYNGGCHSKKKTWGSNVGFVIPLSDISQFDSRGFKATECTLPTHRGNVLLTHQRCKQRHQIWIKIGFKRLNRINNINVTGSVGSITKISFSPAYYILPFQRL